MEQSEVDFLKKYDDSIYDKPSVAVDCVIFRYHQSKLQVLLVKRNEHPFKDFYALPRGFAKNGQSLENTVVSKVTEKTGIVLENHQIDQLKTISTPNRDPRGWVISVSYLCFLPYQNNSVVAKTVETKENQHGEERAVWTDVSFDFHAKKVVLSLNEKRNRRWTCFRPLQNLVRSVSACSGSF